MLSFPGQREDERILMVIRKHPLVYCRLSLAFVLTIVVPLFIFLWFWFRQYPLSLYYSRGLVMGIFSSFYLLYGILFTCVGWINEAFDLFILTSHRLMDITQISLVRRSVTSTPLERIQDATNIVNGILPTLFNYGNLEIQTASGDTKLIAIDRIPHPGETAREIMNAVHNRQHELQGGRQSGSDTHSGGV